MEKEKMGIQADSADEGAPASSLESQSAEVGKIMEASSVLLCLSRVIIKNLMRG